MFASDDDRAVRISCDVVNSSGLSVSPVKSPTSISFFVGTGQSYTVEYRKDGYHQSQGIVSSAHEVHREAQGWRSFAEGLVSSDRLSVQGSPVGTMDRRHL